MRILLDSRDLIELLEHARPCSANALNTLLRAGHHELVFTFTNIREVASPLAGGAEFLRIRTLLQSLEALPHIYLSEVSIPALEIQAAIDAFNQGAECETCNVYTSRWDRTFVMLPGQTRSLADDWVNLRLDEIVYLVLRVSPHVFAAPEHHRGALERLLEEDRKLLRAGQAPARQHFVNSMRKHAATWGRHLPDGKEEEFGRWVYSNPRRCPGLRLNHETYRSLMSNYTDIPETADFSDLAHISAIAYVDAATLDNRMRHYCSAASRKLIRMVGTTDYRDRVHENLAAIVARL